MIILKTLGERIKNLREYKNYTQTYVAGKLGVTQKAYSKIETGNTKLSVENLQKIAEVLDANINEILQTEGKTVYNNYNTHNGEGIIIHKTTSEKLEALYEQLLKAKDEQIVLLKTQNEALMKEISKFGNSTNK